MDDSPYWQPFTLGSSFSCQLKLDTLSVFETFCACSFTLVSQVFTNTHSLCTCVCDVSSPLSVAALITSQWIDTYTISYWHHILDRCGCVSAHFSPLSSLSFQSSVTVPAVFPCLKITSVTSALYVNKPNTSIGQQTPQLSQPPLPENTHNAVCEGREFENEQHCPHGSLWRWLSGVFCVLISLCCRAL